MKLEIVSALMGGLLLFGGTPAVGQNAKPLFDGASLKGWEPHGDADDWKTENGVLMCGGKMAGWLGTADTFSNYVLRLEFRGAERVNSGVFLRSEKEGQ